MVWLLRVESKKNARQNKTRRKLEASRETSFDMAMLALACAVAEGYVLATRGLAAPSRARHAITMGTTTDFKNGLTFECVRPPRDSA